MTNLGEFPRNWFLANAQRRHCRLFTFSIKRERGITRFHDVCTFCVKNTIPFSAGQKLLHFALKELIHFKSKGVFPSNINRRDKAWWFMIGPSHGIHQSSWLKLHWVVSSSVSLISFLSEPALCVTNVIEILVKGNSSFILGPFPIILNGVTYFLKF